MISLRLQIFRSSWTFCSHSVRKCSCITFQRNSLLYEIPKSQKPQKTKNLEIPKSKSKMLNAAGWEKNKGRFEFLCFETCPQKMTKSAIFRKLTKRDFYSRTYWLENGRLIKLQGQGQTSAINRLYKIWNINFRGSN